MVVIDCWLIRCNNLMMDQVVGLVMDSVEIGDAVDGADGGCSYCYCYGDGGEVVVRDDADCNASGHYSDDDSFARFCFGDIHYGYRRNDDCCV